jgi:G3E family GTPase
MTSMTTSSIPVHVVGGYLGSGKTTLLNALLSASREPIAVIVNDFGEVNIDAALISTQHDDVIELTNGCVCCAVGTSLADVLFTILDREQLPSLIVIEASGVADPAAVVAYTHMAGLHNAGTVVLIDTVAAMTTARDTYVGKVFTRQIISADLLALTKCDITSSDTQKDIRTLLSTIAPLTPIVHCSPGVLSELLYVSSPIVEPDNHQLAYSSQRLEKVNFVDDEEIRATVENLPSSVVRAKGIVDIKNGERRLVQMVGRHLAITSTPLTATGIITISVENQKS